jgi:hypothetical protein
MSSWTEQLRQAEAEVTQQNADPLRRLIESAVRGFETIGTAPLLDMLGLPKTTGNARRVGETMRSLGFVPVKSRRLMPGGYRDTVTRGWALAVREHNRGSNIRQGAKVANQKSPIHDRAE